LFFGVTFSNPRLGQGHKLHALIFGGGCVQEV
jgi:hypothetical protein